MNRMGSEQDSLEIWCILRNYSSLEKLKENLLKLQLV
jgi:hypothetical protein